MLRFFQLFFFLFISSTLISQNLEWSKMLGSMSTDLGYSIEELSNGDIVILGEVNDNSGNVNEFYSGTDVWVARLSSNGDIIWSKNLGGSNDDFARSLSVDNSDNIYIAGWSYSTDLDISFNASFTSKNFLFKLNPTGEVIWVKNYSVLNEDKTLFYHVNVLEDHKIFLSGYVEYNASSERNTHNLLVNSEGEIIWENLMDEGLNGSSSEIDSDGNVYSLTQSDILTKFNVQGDSIWSINYSPFPIDILDGPIDLYWDNNDLIFIDQIEIDDQENIFWETRLLKIDTSGVLLNTTSLMFNHFGYDNFVYHDNQNNYILGRIGAGLPGDLNSGIISISNSGQINFDVLNNGGAQWDRLFRGILHSSGSIMAIGKSNSNDGDCENSINPNDDDDDIWLVKFSDDLGIEKTEITKSSIFPNPAKDHIEVKLFNNELIEEVLIYNQFGALISSNSSSPIDISNLNNGIYFLKILSKNGNVLVDKLEVIK